MRHAGALRIDHAMGLTRLWVVPEGRTAAHGAFLKLPEQDLIRLTKLESVRNRAIVLGEDPTRFLSTIQIGITSIGILNGVVGEAVLARPLAIWLQQVGLTVDSAGYVSTAIAVIVITYFSIVIGELVPKRVGQIRPEAIARFAAAPMPYAPCPK